MSVKIRWKLVWLPIFVIGEWDLCKLKFSIFLFTFSKCFHIIKEYARCPKNNLERVIVNPIPMLRALRHCFISRLSLYNVIPPIGTPIQNFQNHDLNVWMTLQNIKESERGVLHITAHVSRTEMESCSFLSQQASTSQQTKSRNIGKVKKNSEEKMKQEKGAEDMSWLAPSSLSDSEVEFSIDIGSQVMCRYSPSDPELSSDNESLRV